MRGVGKVNVAPRDAFPPFLSHYVPCRPHLTAMFVRDYWENKSHMIRELDVGAMWHACVLWEETPHVFLLVLTAAC